MTPGKRYRIGNSTIAVVIEGGKQIATTIPAGEIVELADSPIQAEGLVHVRWKGQIVEMFTQDLLERGQELNSARGPSC